MRTHTAEDGKATLETTILAVPALDALAPVFTCKVTPWLRAALCLCVCMRWIADLRETNGTDGVRAQATECDMAREANGSGRVGLKCAQSACTPLCDK